MPKHLRWLLLPSLVLGLSLSANSEKVDVNGARAIAAEFIKSGAKVSPESLSAQPVYTAGTASKPLYYVFNVADNGGFVIVSAEDCATPVLGYSYEGAYPVNKVPQAMQWVMTGIEREIAAAPAMQKSLGSLERKRIASVAGAKAAEKKSLKTPDWSQEAPFNAMIPGQPLVGCVGTAMATIMKYHQWPASGRGNFDGVDFNTPYNWDEMRMDNYRNGYNASEGEAVAQLMYHASKSIDTQYAMSGSSAYEVRVPAALSNFFGYDPGVSYKKRSDVATQQAWDQIVKDEIDAGRPVLYCGQDVSAGHAFVCDGYEGEYLHFNWGWGGSANGYFLSTALNPTVSRTHHYNNLNTIIYNIKPASGSVAEWSPVHITADGNQPGIGSDLTNLGSGKTFKVRVGNLKNLSYSPFSGKIAVALCDSKGIKKALLCRESNLNLDAMAYLFQGFLDFNKCELPDGTRIEDGDVVRLMTLADGAAEWLPVAGELLTVNELLPVADAPYTFSISLPAGVTGVTLQGENSVIRGWNYSFKATPDNPESDVVTVKANGYVLTPGNDYTYTIANVCGDQEITVLVQNAADVKEKRSVWVGTPGTLAEALPEDEAANVKELTLFGSIDARDFAYIKSSMRPRIVDLTAVQITANGTNQANAIPREAFRDMNSLEEVILPASVNRLNNGCFRMSGITRITIPANVKTYEYNIFVGASKLRDIYVGRESAEFINWCVLSGVNVKATTLHVPNERAVANYSKAENWNTIGNIIVDPIQHNDKAMFAVMENNDVNFECAQTAGAVDKGTKVTFTALHTGDNDNRMEVYANNTLLSADADGNYSADINANTIIHFELVPPIAVDTNPSAWKLTGANGSIGMLTDAVNVIPGQDFTVRLNAIDIPQNYDQFYWGIALTDADGNIKEFVSPVNVWTAGAGTNFKMNVNCKVKDSEVREGNQLRLVTSAMKKVWNVVKGADETITDALPALNNMTPIYNVNIPDVEGVTMSGAVTSAVRGRDITLKIVPNNAAYRIDMSVNGQQVAKGAASVNYTFVVMEDKDFDINVYDPKELGSVTYNVAPGELYKAVTAESVAANVIVTGSTYASDISNAFTQSFAKKTVKKLDMSTLEIIADPTNSNNVANMIPSEMFWKSSSIDQSKPVIEEIILPNAVTKIGDAAFKNCEKLKEIRLPESLIADRIQVGTYASGSPKYGYPIGAGCFDGCTSLTTIYIPGPLKTVNGRQVVCHFNPYCTYYDYDGMDQILSYILGHKVGDRYDASQTTIVVPKEYLSIYKAAYKDSNYGNPWQKLGYNIVAENPVYALNYDASRIEATSDFDPLKAASFLGENVSLESIALEGKLKLKDSDAKCKVYDNGEPVELAEDGTIPVVFYNPAKNADKSGNHDIKVVYEYDLTFNSASDSFTVTDAQVSNDGGYHFESFLNPEGDKAVLKNIAENSAVRFRVSFSTEHGNDLEARVMADQNELIADEEGYYTVNITNASRALDIFAVAHDGATLNAEDIASINPDEGADVTTVALEGEMTAETFSHAIGCFPNLENIDLSEYAGEIPEGAFAGMETIATVVLPEISEISDNMFSGCSNLASIDVPTSVNYIGEGAFKDCASLESIRLTGIDAIGDNAFSGCENLTTITLLTDVAAEAAGAEVKSVRPHSTFGSKAFDGMNPNCIVLLDEGVSKPDAVANYIYTATGTVTETMPDGSEVEREGRVYSAHSPILFIEGHPLSIPHTFTLADDASVSLEAAAGGWKGMVIPFDAETVRNSEGSELTLSKGSQTDPEKSSYLVYGLDENIEDPIRMDGVKANVPCFIYTHYKGDVTFEATKGIVPATPKEISVNGVDYTLHAVYTASALPASETYLLNEDATAFLPADSEDENVDVAPFGLYATTPEALSEIKTNLPDSSVISEVNEVIIPDTLRFVKENGSAVVYSPDSRIETIYSADGKAVRSVTLQPGRNVIDLPAGGVYIIRDTKLLF